jgi:anti-sigma B factor antagonist
LTDLAVDQIDPSVSMISLRGEHDLNSAPDLKKTIAEAQQQGSGIVLDLSPTTFLDSSILAVLIDAQRNARVAGLGLALYTGNGLADGVGRILAVTGLDGELRLLQDRDAAIAAVREGLA